MPASCLRANHEPAVALEERYEGHGRSSNTQLCRLCHESTVRGGTLSIVNITERFLRHPGGRTALTGRAPETTYGQLADRSARWRGGLAAAGVGPGDRVVVVTDDPQRFVLAYLAVVGGGAVIVPLNPASPPPELLREAEAVAPAAALVDPDVPLGGVRLAPVTLDPARLDGGPPSPIVAVEPDAPAVLLFTSGTAGQPRPAILTHGNLDASLRAIDALGLGLADTHHVAVAVVPLFHVFGFNTVLNLGLDVGATLVLEEYRGPGELAAAVARHRATILAGPPTLWQALTAADGIEPADLATLAIALSGAAKLPPEVAATARDRLGVPLSEGYGLTETSAIVATAVGTDAPLGSVGRLMPGVEARLVDGEGGDVLIGDPGELWVRGPMVSPGYYRPTGTLSCTDADGWLHTGDIAVVDDQGHLSIVDRAKDVVIVSGFNVHPAEVEAVLVDHPAVAGAGVVGEPSTTTGETLVAHVVFAPGRHAEPDELIEHCRANLARYKVPTRFEVTDELPFGVVGKLRRRELGSPGS